MSGSLKSLLKKDSTFIKFSNILETANSLAEFENYCTELENMHKGRKSRTLVYKKISTERLIRCIMQDASYRARCVEIMVQVTKAQRMLEAATEEIYNHIFVKYKPYLQQFRTKAEKDSYVHAILKSSYSKQSDFNRIIEVARSIIEDIDKFSWATKNIVEAMKLVFQKETVVGLKTHTV